MVLIPLVDPSMRARLVLAVVALAFVRPAPAADPTFTRKEDVVYGRKFGLALTMDVFTPTGKKNGAGVVYCVSGGWFSAKEAIRPAFYQEFLDRGYVVFAVVHGSQPKFTIPEVLDDMHRAVRYIRAHAKEYGVDKDRLGIAGGAGRGHPVPHAGDP